MSEQLKDWLDPERSALCIVDLQFDFASEDGQCAKYNMNMASVNAAIINMKRLYSSARDNNIQVYFIGLKTHPDTDSEAWKNFMLRKGFDPDELYAICRDNSKGSEFYEILPQQGDHIIHKPKYSAFYETDFAERLKKQNIDTLLVCGLTTECCVDSTIRDAYHRDFSVFIIGDACAAYRQDFHDVSLEILEESFAINIATDKTIDAFHLLGTRRLR